MVRPKVFLMELIFYRWKRKWTSITNRRHLERPQRDGRQAVPCGSVSLPPPERQLVCALYTAGDSAARDQHGPHRWLAELDQSLLSTPFPRVDQEIAHLRKAPSVDSSAATLGRLSSPPPAVQSH